MAILPEDPLLWCAALAPVFWTCIVLIVAIRRAYFHPFANVPGPRLAKVTSLYSAYHSWIGDMHLDVQRCHAKYGLRLLSTTECEPSQVSLTDAFSGDIIRYAPNQILSLCPEDLSTIYGHGKPFRKSKGYETMIPIPDGWSAMTSIDKTLHHNLRRVFRLGVGADSLARFEPAVIRHLKVYFSQLTKDIDSDGWSSPADMRKWNLCLGFDTMAEFGLGVKTDLLRSPAREFVLPALHVHEKKMGLWEQLPILNDLGIGNLISRLLLHTSSRVRLFADWYQGFLDQAIANNTTESRGIFGPVVQSGQGLLDKPGHNKAQMVGEGSFSTFSSADAYSIMLSGFLHYLCHNRHVYEKLAGELRATFQSGEEVVWDARLESSVYLRAVIDEVMRLLPPACGVHWRECEEHAGAPVVVGPGGELPLPVGCDVGMSLFSLFRDGRVFRDPVRFWPERWLPGTLPEEELALSKKMFVPFLLGPRNCAGSHVAIRIASIAFAYVLVNYDFRLSSRWPELLPRVGKHAFGEPGTESELVFESHYSIAGWETGPIIEFKARTSRK